MDTNLPEVQAEAICLKRINDVLLMHHCDLTEFGLTLFDDLNASHNIHDENEVIDIEHLKSTLNRKQRHAYEDTMKPFADGNSNKLFFIDGPGGSGKSYLHNVLIDVFNTRNIRVLSVAWTGIAAILLKGGQTAHTAFKLPINLTKTSTCGIKKNSSYAKNLKDTQVIIWDEISMANLHAFEAVNTFLQDLCDTEEIFGGKVVILSGDFRQILPVVPKGKKMTFSTYVSKVAQYGTISRNIRYMKT